MPKKEFHIALAFADEVKHWVGQQRERCPSMHKELKLFCAVSLSHSLSLCLSLYLSISTSLCVIAWGHGCGELGSWWGWCMECCLHRAFIHTGRHTAMGVSAEAGGSHIWQTFLVSLGTLPLRDSAQQRPALPWSWMSLSHTAHLAQSTVEKGASLVCVFTALWQNSWRPSLSFRFTNSGRFPFFILDATRRQDTKVYDERGRGGELLCPRPRKHFEGEQVRCL